VALACFRSANRKSDLHGGVDADAVEEVGMSLRRGKNAGRAGIRHSAAFRHGRPGFELPIGDRRCLSGYRRPVRSARQPTGAFAALLDSPNRRASVTPRPNAPRACGSVLKRKAIPT